MKRRGHKKEERIKRGGEKKEVRKKMKGEKGGKKKRGKVIGKRHFKRPWTFYMV